MSPARSMALAGGLAAVPIIALGLAVPIPEAVIGGTFGLVCLLPLAGVMWFLDRGAS